jgi:hypothetical protein
MVGKREREREDERRGDPAAQAATW